MSPDPADHGAEAREAVRAVIREALDREADWSALAEAGLLSLAVPEAYGGEGLGLAEIAVLLRETGARASHLPVWETLCCGALTLAAAGSDEQQARLLPGIATGEVVLTPAVREVGAGIPERPRRPSTDGRITGRKVGVTHADGAAALLVPAMDGDDVVVALVDPAADGVTLHASPSSSGRTEHTVVLDGAPAELLPGEGAARLLRELRGRRALRHRIGGRRRRARPDRGVHQGAHAVRPQARRVPGGREADRRRLHRVPADHAGRRQRGLAGDRGPRRHRRPGGRGVLASATRAWPRCTPASTCTAGWASTRPTRCTTTSRGSPTSPTRSAGRGSPWTPSGSRTPAAKNLELTEEQRRLKAELRDYFTGLADHDEHRDMMVDRHGPTYQKTIRQMGSDGWMGVGWPKEYGGHGLGEIEQTIFANEAQRADVHLPAVTLQTVGPTLIRYGTEKQKDLFLKRILAGDVHFAIGYSEPDAGTDLASLRTTARRDGDHYVVNGQKMWTTGGHQADYVWLAVRTDPDAPKHQGISILIVDTSDPGYSWTPIITADGSHHVNATYFNDVRVPVDMLVGEENQGWKLITTQLNHERVMLGPAGRLEGLRDRVAAWADSARRGRRARRTPHPRRGDRGVPRQRAAQLGGRPRRRAGRDLGCRRVVVEGLRLRPGAVPRPDPGRRRAPVRRPGGPRHR